MSFPIGMPGLPVNGSIAPLRAVPPAVAPTATPAQDGAFRQLLDQSISTVESQRAAAQQSVDRFLSGEGEELHQVALATQKAELSFEMFLQVRNKVVQAYQEVMRMQI